VDDRKRELKGSESRDAFKHWHKTGHRSFYGCDMDFVLVEKCPPGIAAVVDYKKPGDRITFSEVIAYNALLDAGTPVYIIESVNLQRFTVYEYMGGDPKPEPPLAELRTVLLNGTEADYWQWENALRMRYRNAAK